MPPAAPADASRAVVSRSVAVPGSPSTITTVYGPVVPLGGGRDRSGLGRCPAGAQRPVVQAAHQLGCAGGGLIPVVGEQQPTVLSVRRTQMGEPAEPGPVGPARLRRAGPLRADQHDLQVRRGVQCGELGDDGAGQAHSRSRGPASPSEPAARSETVTGTAGSRPGLRERCGPRCRAGRRVSRGGPVPAPTAGGRDRARSAAARPGRARCRGWAVGRRGPGRSSRSGRWPGRAPPSRTGSGLPPASRLAQAPIPALAEGLGLSLLRSLFGPLVFGRHPDPARGGALAASGAEARVLGVGNGGFVVQIAVRVAGRLGAAGADLPGVGPAADWAWLDGEVARTCAGAAVAGASGGSAVGGPRVGDLPGCGAGWAAVRPVRHRRRAWRPVLHRAWRQHPGPGRHGSPASGPRRPAPRPPSHCPGRSPRR